MKNVLLIVNVFHPDRGGGAAVFSDLAFALAEKGVNVVVFTTNPYYPEWKNKSQANPLTITRERINGVTVFRHGIYIPNNPSSLLQRALYEASFFFSLSRSLFRCQRFDLVVAYCPLLGCLPFANLRTFLRREKLWLNVQDIPADAAASTGFTGGKILKWFLNKVQRTLFRRANVVSTISPIMVKRVQQICGNDREVQYAPNWLNKSIADEIRTSQRLTQDANSIQLLYAGNIGNKQNTKEFCDKIKKSDWRFKIQIFGDGGQAAGVKRWIDDAHDERFAHGPFLKEREFVAELKNCDYFVITEMQGIGGSFIPSKLIPSISAGTPILAVCDRDSPLGTEVRTHELGVVVEWNELHSLHERFPQLLQSRDQFSQNCLRRAQFYNRDVNVSKLIDVYNRSFSKARAPKFLQWHSELKRGKQNHPSPR